MDDPSYVWVLIAILGAVADVAAFTKVLRSASKIKEAVDVLDTGGVATFEKKILEISDLEEKVKDNLIKQARLKERIAVVGMELRGTMNSGFNPKLFEYELLSMKNGVTSFDGFIKELKLVKLIKETGLSSEELRGLKDLFNQAKLLSKDKKLMAELDEAVAKKDYDRVKKLLEEATNISHESDELAGLVKDSRGVYGYLPKDGSRYHAFFDKFMDADWVARQRAIRQGYLKQSEALEETIKTMTKERKTSEQIARHVVERRNLQKVEARAYMLDEEVKALEAGNIKKYGNPIGPSADDLFDSKGSWEAIIESSMVKDKEINKLLGL